MSLWGPFLDSGQKPQEEFLCKSVQNLTQDPALGLRAASPSASKPARIPQVGQGKGGVEKKGKFRVRDGGRKVMRFRWGGRGHRHGGYM